MAVKGTTVIRVDGEDYTINEPNIEDEFSSSSSYTKGDYCYYQGNLYRFTSDHAAGAWNSDHAAAVKVMNELNSKEAGLKSELNSKATELEETDADIKKYENDQAFDFGSDNISSMSSTFGVETGIRVNDIEAEYTGYLEKIIVKGKTSNAVPLPIYIMKKATETTLEIIDIFTVLLPFHSTVDTYEFVNGIHFLCNTKIEKGYMIGWYNSSGRFQSCYSTNGQSYKTTSEENLTIDTTSSFDVGLKAVCVSELSGNVRKCFGTANAVKKYGLFLNYAMPNYSDNDEYTVKVKPTTIEGSYITIHKKEDNNTLRSVLYAGVYFLNNKFGFYRASKDGDTLEAFEIRKCRFTFAANHEYAIVTTKIMNSFIKLTVTDMYTLETDSVIASCINVGYGWGAWSSRFYNNMEITNPIAQYRYILNPAKPRCLILGDSITEGIVMAENGDRTMLDYSFRIKEKLNDDVYIESRSGVGSTGIKNYLQSYLSQICEPEYVIIYIGTNDSNYDTWLANIESIIETVQGMHATPVLVTIAPNAGGSASILSDMNTWIRQSGYKYIDANIVLSLNNDGETANSALYYADLSHPNTKGHERLFKRAMIDVPELFVNIAESI